MRQTVRQLVYFVTAIKNEEVIEGAAGPLARFEASWVDMYPLLHDSCTFFHSHKLSIMLRCVLRCVQQSVVHSAVAVKTKVALLCVLHVHPYKLPFI